ncbi:beta strand repeat-containing protein, partial [Sphingopyxis sp. H115]|uniref:beta strand repeat-containing protein n=1 Tax=Sphingopyxis sp. H115 TaxID=1759073 RepID=UPI0007361B87
GGGGSGGTLHLVTNGGTLSSNGEAVAISVGGVSGTGGSGGIGNGGGSDGTGGGSLATTGGRVVIEALNGPAGAGTITLGNTQIDANGDVAGRIELRAEGNIDFLGLDAEAAGFADPTNNDTDVAPAGIFLAMNGGTISSQGDVTFTTDSSFGAYAQSNGIVDVDGILTIDAADQIDIRHDFREGIAPTIRAGGNLTATAGGISGAPGSLLASGGTLSLTSTLGAIGVDQLDAVNIVIGATGAAAVEHAEAANDFTATGTSFRTGPNSIITGGDIIVTTPGTVDLGNSTAGGFVSVSGLSIVFNMIDAGNSVFLNANDDVPGALGISGGSINSGGNVDLNAAGIAITGTVSGTGALFANGYAGDVAIGLANFDGPISISATGDIGGTYNSGGDIRLNSGADINAAANAIGSQSSSSGPPIAASVFAEAAGDIILANSSASGMFGANAGGSVSLASVTAGEDLLVRSGSLATLADVGAGDDLTVLSGSDIVASGLLTTGAGPDGQTLFYNDDPVSFVGFGVTSSAPDGANITLAAASGSIAANSGNASGNLTVTAGGAVTSTGLLQSGQATTVTGGNLALAAITAGTDIATTANAGDFTATGTLTAGHDIGIAAVDAVDVAGLDAGDDIRVSNGGDAAIGNAFSRGTGLDNEGDGSNIVLSAGITRVDHAEADSDFVADVAGFSTGLNSIITGGDIVIASATGVDLGNSTAGGLVSVGGETIAFNSITAGTTVSLNATGLAGSVPEINGGSIAAGGDINLSANRIAVDGPVTSDAGLFAFGGDTVAIGQADIAGDIVISAGGDLTGAYVSGGNILLTSGADITASAVASGGYVGPNGISEGYVLADADGNATLSNSGAATMLGVRAGQAASISNAAAGEDVFVTAGTNATLGNITAGDDISAAAAGSISANGLTTTGTGPDGRSVIYGPITAGIDALQITTTAADQSNIALTASTGNISGSAMDAFDNLSLTAAGAIAATGTLRSGQTTSIVGRDVVFDAIDAGTTVGISASGTAAGAEGIRGVDIGAGDNITLDGNSIAITGTVEGDASLFATASGATAAIDQADLAGNIAISAAGNLTGTYVAGGDVSLTASGNVNASATANGTAADGNLFVDAGGNVVLANSAAARMFGINAGGSAAIAGGTAGEDLLVRAGTTAALTNVTAGDDVDIRAGGNVTANNVIATGNGADTHLLDYLPGSGFTIMQGEGVSSINGSDIAVTSTGGSIDAAGLSAGDDITLLATGGNAALSNGTTLGLGATGGSSDISVQAAGATLAGLDSADDVLVTTSGTTTVDGTIVADRNIVINADAVSLAALSTPGGNAIDTLAADGNITIASANDIAGGRMNALGDISLIAGGAVDVGGIYGNDVAIDGATGIAADELFALGTTTLNSDNGAIALNTLVSSGNIDASADSITIDGGSMIFSTITTDVGDAIVRGGDLFVIDGNIAGRAEFSSSGERLGITTLTAQSAALEASGGFMTLETVNVAGTLSATARTSLGITGTVTGQSIALASANIDIASTGRVGTAGTTGAVSIANNNPDNQTFVGGTGTPNGYHIDADELTRVFGSDVEIFAPEVEAASGGSVGSATPPDVIVDSFTMTGGAAGSNLGANGQLTIRTPGKMRVVGNVELTGLTDTNALNLFAGEALEVILGQGSVRLLNGNAPAGQLNLASEDIIVATAEAIADVGAAATTDAIEARLAQNDGVLLDEGALFARGIRAEVVGGFYVQNSGAGTDFAQRRGLTFGAGGLDVLTEGPSRIVINGVHLGPNGQVTGLDTIPLLTIAGEAPVPGSFDPRSTFNGCLIAATGSCNLPTQVDNFPVQDVIEEEVKTDDDGKGDGNNLPQSLITMRDLDPLSGEPLLDDPVTGAGNDDLWTPEFDSCDPGSASGGTCPAAQ